MTILFVCSGNTCRSPLAVAAWSRLAGADSHALKSTDVVSAGAFASEGAPASRHAVTVAQGWGCDLSAHRARQLRDEDIKRADLICTMTQSQAEVLRGRYPADAAKVRVLGQWRSGRRQAAETEDTARLQSLVDGGSAWPDDEGALSDIMDPYGGSMEAYRSCASQIEDAVAGLCAALQRNEVEGL
ncbi:MAG TPA: low molecular weight protein arginine phosphatase [Abditibacteriaceae bacterium]|jgi:protein-tyrosine phosphatase